jgi:hypothetical protein
LKKRKRFYLNSAATSKVYLQETPEKPNLISLHICPATVFLSRPSVYIFVCHWNREAGKEKHFLISVSVSPNVGLFICPSVYLPVRQNNPSFKLFILLSFSPPIAVCLSVYQSFFHSFIGPSIHLLINPYFHSSFSFSIFLSIIQLDKQTDGLTNRQIHRLTAGDRHFHLQGDRQTYRQAFKKRTFINQTQVFEKG